MTPVDLAQYIQQKKSFLCVGLDTDVQKIPQHLHLAEDPVFEFNRQIIDATQAYTVAYKMNIAFYESLGVAGWNSLEKTLDYIPDHIFTIADAKRGDIGNTSRMYARTFFDTYSFDAVTVAPYMGRDSVAPFLEYPGKWVFLLALTSNAGSQDFQHMQEGGEALFERVIRHALNWEAELPGELGFVLGATRTAYLSKVRASAPDAFFLVPGIGAQGGDLEAVCRETRTDKGGLLINSSRGIIYAGMGEGFAAASANAAQALQIQMAPFTDFS